MGYIYIHEGQLLPLVIVFLNIHVGIDSLPWAA